MRPTLLALLLLVPLVAGCGGGSGGSGTKQQGAQAAASKSIAVSETEFELDPATVKLAHAGTYAFKVRNKGQYTHALAIEGNGVDAQTSTIDPSGRATLKVALKDGSYTLYCPVDGHADKGMKGTLTVGGASSGGSTTPTNTGRSGYGY